MLRLQKSLVGGMGFGGFLMFVYVFLFSCFGGMVGVYGFGKRVIRRVNFIGLDRKRLIAIEEKVETSVGKVFQEVMIDRDIKRLYRSGQFSSVEVKVTPLEDGVSVRVEFFLQERPLLQRVLIFGRESVDLEEISKRIRSKKGRYFNPALIRLDKERIRALYREKGYFFVDVQHKVRVLDSSRVELYFFVQEGPQLQLYDVRVVGNRKFTESEILYSNLQSDYKLAYRHKPFYTYWFHYMVYLLFSWALEETYDEPKFIEDIDRIKAFYRRHGYFDAQVFYDNMEYNSWKDRVVITVRVREGERYRVGRVRLRIRGEARLGRYRTLEEKERYLLSLLRLRGGKFFSAEVLQEDLKALQRAYRRYGYVLARVSFKLVKHLDRARMGIDYTIVEGERIRIREIRIRGNTRTREDVIRRYLTFRPGEWFNGDKVEESYFRIHGTRFFEKFDLKMEKGGSSSRRDVVIEVKEGRTGSFIFGGGLSSDFGFFGNFQFRQNNFDIADLPKSWDDFLSGNAFVGGGQVLSISLQPGFERSSYNIYFQEPYLFGYPYSFGLNGFFYNRDQLYYTEQRSGGSVTLGKRLTDYLLVDLSYGLENIKIYNLDPFPPQDILDVRGYNLMSSLTLGLVYSRQKIDKNFIAYGGFKISASYQYAGGFLGGDFDFSKADVRGQVFFWLWGSEDFKHVLAFRARGGWVERHSDTRKVPLFERFFLGGVRSLRGFEYRGVGPQDRGVTIGGNVLVLGTAEYNFPLLGNILRGVLFADAGKVASGISQMRREDFRVSLGFGFRIQVPLFPAPLQLDFGFPIKRSEGDRRQTFHFSLGFNF